MGICGVNGLVETGSQAPAKIASTLFEMYLRRMQEKIITFFSKKTKIEKREKRSELTF